jgi:hypothetical protein
MPQQVIEKCNRLGLNSMNDIEQAVLKGYKDLFGEMNSMQTLLVCIEQEAIIAVYGQDTKNIQSVSKTKIAIIRRDRFLNYALLLEKEENLLKQTG